MDYISVKNLEKYQPHYKDGRSIIWVRWDIAALGDYKISKLTPAQRWLFLGLICVACRQKNKIPLDFEWISSEVRYQDKHISDDINLLQQLELVVVTKCDEMLQTLKVDVPTNRHTDIHTNKGVPPSLEEVTSYCKERKNGVNPTAFINHYQAKGWMIGKNKMKDWQAAVRTWESTSKATTSGRRLTA